MYPHHVNVNINRKRFKVRWQRYENEQIMIYFWWFYKVLWIWLCIGIECLITNLNTLVNLILFATQIASESLFYAKSSKKKWLWRTLVWFVSFLRNSHNLFLLKENLLHYIFCLMCRITHCCRFQKIHIILLKYFSFHSNVSVLINKFWIDNRNMEKLEKRNK